MADMTSTLNPYELTKPFAKNIVGRLTQIAAGKGHAGRGPFREMPVDEDRSAARGLASRDVSPAVADHVAVRKIDGVPGGGRENHPRLRLAALTAVLVDVFARKQIVEAKGGDDRTR